MDLKKLTKETSDSIHVNRLLDLMQVYDWIRTPDQPIKATRYIRIDVLGWGFNSEEHLQRLDRSLDQLMDMFIDQAITEFPNARIKLEAINRTKEYLADQYCMARSNEGVYKGALPSFSDVQKNGTYNKMISFNAIFQYGSPSTKVPPSLDLSAVISELDVIHEKGKPSTTKEVRIFSIFPYQGK